MKILRMNDVMAMTGLARVTIYRYIKIGLFPQPTRLSPTTIGWPESAIQAWLAACAGRSAEDVGTRVLRISEVSKMVGIARSTLYRYIDRGLFPKQIKIGPNASGWLETDIRAWIGSRSGQASDAVEEKVLRMPDVIAKTGLSRSAVLKSVQQGLFPKQVRFGPRLIGWREADILGWIAAQAGGRPVASDDKVLRITEVVKMTGVPESAMYACIKEGTFPKQISLGSRAVGWIESDVRAWLERRPDLCVDNSDGDGVPSPRKNQITARELFARALLVMRKTSSPDQMARACGVDPDALIPCGRRSAGVRSW